MALTPATLLTGAALSLAAWGVGFAYQCLRYRIFDTEDAVQLAAARAGEASASWVESVRRQAPRGMVSAATMAELVDLGLIEADFAANVGRAVAAYRPGAARVLVIWLPVCLGATAAILARGAFAPAHELNTLAALAYTLSFALIAMADARFRIVPVPFLITLVAGALFAFPWASPVALAVSAGMSAIMLWGASKLFESTFMRAGVCGMGDVLIMAVIFATLLCSPVPRVMGTFLVAFIASCAVLVAHYSRGMKLTLGGFTMLRVPLGPAAAIASIATMAVI